MSTDDIDVNVADIDSIHSLNSNNRFDLKNEYLYGSLYKDFLRDFSPIECKFYDEVQIKSTLNSYDFEYLSCFSINCQSILSNFNNITNFIDVLSYNRSKVSVIFCQETWHNFDLCFEGYEYINKSRTFSRGGGVALIINKEYQYEQIDDSSFYEEGIFECITAKIFIDSEEFIVSSFYHPPTKSGIDKATSDRIFLEKLSEYLNFLNSFEIPSFFGSDTNVDLFQIDNLNSMAIKMFEVLSFDSFINPITKATRITQNTCSLIDIIGSKGYIGNLVLNGVCTTHIADHLIPFNIFKLCLKKKNTKPPEYFNKRTFTDAKLNSFKNALAIQDWREVLREKNDVSQAYGKFISIFMSLFDKHIPRQRIKFNRRTMAISKHMSKGLLKSRLSKQKLYLKFLQTLSQQSWINFTTFRNLYNKICRKARILTIRKDLRDSKGNSKRLWKILKENIGMDKKDIKVDHLLINGEKVCDSQKMADAFNSHFSKIGPDLTRELPKTNKSYKDYLGERTDKNFYLFPVSEYQLRKFIGRMHPKKSCDVNEISMFLINFVKESISLPYSHIINTSFKLGQMPDQTKVSRTIIIHKGGPTNLLDQYRGVSLINSFSKIHEKIVYTKLLNFLESNSFFAKRQYGFRPGRSTFHAILDLTNRLTKALASGKIAMTILLDVRKCFDMLDRNILLGKLEHFGVRGLSLDFFKSYFKDRKQRVFFKNCNSNTLEDILWGVLQGSIMGVLLFLLYINDFQNCSDDILSFLFADDNVVEIEADNLTDLINKANEQIPKVLSWYNSNKLLLHPKKTKVLIFGMPRQLRFFSDHDLGLLSEFPVFLNMNDEGENLDNKITKLDLTPNLTEKSVRHLGVQYDHELTFKFHLKKIYSKISSIIFTLNQMKNILDGKHLQLLYSAYIKSNIEYCCALFAGMPECYIKPIIKLQKRAVRIIAGASIIAHTENLFKDLRILPYDKLIIFNVCKFMFSYKINKVPEPFYNTWQTKSEMRGRNLRNDDDFYIPFTNKTYLKNLPFFKFPYIWNSLPVNIKSIKDKNLFLETLTQHLLDQIHF